MPATDASGADWLDLCRRATAGVRAALARYPLAADREVTTGRGEGGDLALVIDRAAEDAIFAELDALGVPLVAISEERGRVQIGGGGPVQVVIDPIDGSLNAKRGIPAYSVSIAVATGETMGDVQLGYVYDLARDEEWWARAGGGAHIGGTPLAPPADGARLEILGLEMSRPPLVVAAAQELAATHARRLRALGSVALSMCWVAAGRMDAMATLGSTRSVDAAAGQLIVREAAGAVSFPAFPDYRAVGLGLEMRSPVIAARPPSLLAEIEPVGLRALTAPAGPH